MTSRRRSHGEPWLEAEAGVKPRSPKGRPPARGLDGRLCLQHPLMRAGDASYKTQSKYLDGDHGIYRDRPLPAVCLALEVEVLPIFLLQRGRRVKAHCCPQRTRRHVRSWRKATIRSGTGLTPVGCRSDQENRQECENGLAERISQARSVLRPALFIDSARRWTLRDRRVRRTTTRSRRRRLGSCALCRSCLQPTGCRRGRRI